MLDVQSWRSRHAPSAWAATLTGGLAGLSAVGVLLSRPPLVAASYLVGGAVALVVLVQPHIGLLLLVAAMIGQWPGQVLKFGGAAVGVSALLWAVNRRRPLVARDPILLVLAVYAAVVWRSAVSLPRDLAPSEALAILDPFSLALTYTSFLVLYWTVTTLTTESRVVRRLIGVMIISGVIVALIGLLQYRLHFLWVASTTLTAREASLLSDAERLDALTFDGSFRIESITGTPDFLGMIMQILAPFALFWALQQPTRSRQLLGFTGVGLITAAMLLSFTRGVMVSTALIVVPMVAWRIGWRRSLPVLAVGLAIVVLVLLAWESLRERALSTIAEWVDADPTTAGGWRRLVLPVALRMVMDNVWTGVGIGRSALYFNLHAPSELAAPLPELQAPIHNAYLAIGLELGGVGLALLVLVLVVGLVRIHRLVNAFRAGGEPLLWGYAAAAEAGWLAMMFNIAFYPQVDQLRYFWLLLAVIGALGRVRPAGV